MLLIIVWYTPRLANFFLCPPFCTDCPIPGYGQHSVSQSGYQASLSGLLCTLHNIPFSLPTMQHIYLKVPSPLRYACRQKHQMQLSPLRTLVSPPDAGRGIFHCNPTFTFHMNIPCIFWQPHITSWYGILWKPCCLPYQSLSAYNCPAQILSCHSKSSCH